MNPVKKFFSNIDKKKLLFSIVKFDDIVDERINISPDEEFMQSSVSKLKKGYSARPHKHNHYERKVLVTQESWVILKGKVHAKMYDLDDKKIYECTLETGDIFTNYYGGHSLTVEEDAIFCEFKNGPFFGNTKDKVYID